MNWPAIGTLHSNSCQRDDFALDTSQYTLCGSELLLCIANTVARPEILKSRGIPTVIVCNVPFSDVGVDSRKELARLLSTKIFQSLVTTSH